MERKIGIPGDLVHHDLVIPFSVNVPNLWHHTFMKIAELHARGITGKGVAIAINDTGIIDHPLLPRPLASKDFTGSPSGVKDKQGHGSHCAGIALGRRGDDGRALGVAPDAELLVAKVLGDNGSGSTTGINAGRVLVAKEAARLGFKNKLVISESLGDGGGPPISADLQAFDEAYDEGAAICVAALGNAGFNGVGRPGSYDRVCGVAALRENGTRADYSSVGDPADLAAPGSNILSCNLSGGYTSMSGTSMATPFIAGVMALVIQHRQDIGLPALVGWRSWTQFWKDPRFVADAGAPGHDPQYGWGIPQVHKIVDWMLNPQGA